MSVTLRLFLIKWGPEYCYNMVINILFFHKKKEEVMAAITRISGNFYSKDWLESVHSTNHSFLVPLEDRINPDSISIRTLFAPSAGAFYVYHPSKRRRALNRAVDKLEATRLPGFEYVISYLYNKCRCSFKSNGLQNPHISAWTWSWCWCYGITNGLGLEEPRIKAEVKHRPKLRWAQMICSTGKIEGK